MAERFTEHRRANNRVKKVGPRVDHVLRRPSDLGTAVYRATMARNQHIYFLVHVSRERFKIGRATYPALPR